MSEQASGHLYLAPFTPLEGVFREQRAMGVGVAITLSILLSRCNYPISVFTYAPADADDLVPSLLRQNSHSVPQRLIGGYYHPETLTPLKLVIMVPSQSAILDQNTFEITQTSNVESLGRTIGSWLTVYGAGIKETSLREPSPETIQDLLVEMRVWGLLWLIDAVPSVVNAEFLATLEEAMTFFQVHIHELYAGRRLRELLLDLIPAMVARQRPADEGVVSQFLGQVSEHLNPAGLEFIWPVLEAGTIKGADIPAFLACQGYVWLTLGHPEEALKSFTALCSLLPRAGDYAIGLAYTDLGRWDEAINAFNEAISLTQPEEPFVDIVRGQDAVPEPEGRTWLGVLLEGRGLAELRSGQFASAEATLKQALGKGVEPIHVLRTLAHVYRNWGLELLKSSPEAARLRLLQHVDTLESLFAIAPREEDVAASLDVAQYYQDPELTQRWLLRRHSLVK